MSISTDFRFTSFEKAVEAVGDEQVTILGQRTADYGIRVEKSGEEKWHAKIITYFKVGDRVAVLEESWSAGTQGKQMIDGEEISVEIDAEKFANMMHAAGEMTELALSEKSGLAKNVSFKQDEEQITVHYSEDGEECEHTAFFEDRVTGHIFPFDSDMDVDSEDYGGFQASLNELFPGLKPIELLKTGSVASRFFPHMEKGFVSFKDNVEANLRARGLRTRRRVIVPEKKKDLIEKYNAGKKKLNTLIEEYRSLDKGQARDVVSKKICNHFLYWAQLGQQLKKTYALIPGIGHKEVFDKLYTDCTMFWAKFTDGQTKTIEKEITNQFNQAFAQFEQLKDTGDVHERLKAYEKCEHLVSIADVFDHDIPDVEKCRHKLNSSVYSLLRNNANIDLNRPVTREAVRLQLQDHINHSVDVVFSDIKDVSKQLFYLQDKELGEEGFEELAPLYGKLYASYKDLEWLANQARIPQTHVSSTLNQAKQLLTKCEKLGYKAPRNEGGFFVPTVSKTPLFGPTAIKEREKASKDYIDRIKDLGTELDNLIKEGGKGTKIQKKMHELLKCYERCPYDLPPSKAIENILFEKPGYPKFQGSSFLKQRVFVRYTQTHAHTHLRNTDGIWTHSEEKFFASFEELEKIKIKEGVIARIKRDDATLSFDKQDKINEQMRGVKAEEWLEKRLFHMSTKDKQFYEKMLEKGFEDSKRFIRDQLTHRLQILEKTYYHAIKIAYPTDILESNVIEAARKIRIMIKALDEGKTTITFSQGEREEKFHEELFSDELEDANLDKEYDLKIEEESPETSEEEDFLDDLFKDQKKELNITDSLKKKEFLTEEVSPNLLKKNEHLLKEEKIEEIDKLNHKIKILEEKNEKNINEMELKLKNIQEEKEDLRNEITEVQEKNKELKKDFELSFNRLLKAKQVSETKAFDEFKKIEKENIKITKQSKEEIHFLKELQKKKLLELTTNNEKIVENLNKNIKEQENSLQDLELELKKVKQEKLDLTNKNKDTVEKLKQEHDNKVRNLKDDVEKQKLVLKDSIQEKKNTILKQKDEIETLRKTNRNSLEKLRLGHQKTLEENNKLLKSLQIDLTKVKDEKKLLETESKEKIKNLKDNQKIEVSNLKENHTKEVNKLKKSIEENKKLIEKQKIQIEKMLLDKEKKIEKLKTELRPVKVEGYSIEARLKRRSHLSVEQREKRFNELLKNFPKTQKEQVGHYLELQELRINLLENYGSDNSLSREDFAKKKQRLDLSKVKLSKQAKVDAKQALLKQATPLVKELNQTFSKELYLRVARIEQVLKELGATNKDLLDIGTVLGQNVSEVDVSYPRKIRQVAFIREMERLAGEWEDKTDIKDHTEIYKKMESCYLDLKDALNEDKHSPLKEISTIFEKYRKSLTQRYQLVKHNLLSPEKRFKKSRIKSSPLLNQPRTDFENALKDFGKDQKNGLALLEKKRLLHHHILMDTSLTKQKRKEAINKLNLEFKKGIKGSEEFLAKEVETEVKEYVELFEKSDPIPGYLNLIKNDRTDDAARESKGITEVYFEFADAITAFSDLGVSSKLERRLKKGMKRLGIGLNRKGRAEKLELEMQKFHVEQKNGLELLESKRLLHDHILMDKSLKKEERQQAIKSLNLEFREGIKGSEELLAKEVKTEVKEYLELFEKSDPIPGYLNLIKNNLVEDAKRESQAITEVYFEFVDALVAFKDLGVTSDLEGRLEKGMKRLSQGFDHKEVSHERALYVDGSRMDN